MHLGIFDMVYPRDGMQQRMEAIAAAGFTSIQLDFAAAGLSSMPTVIPDIAVETISNAAHLHGIDIAAIGGTYNMIHPDPTLRTEGLASLHAMAAVSGALGCPIITLSTGTRDAANMWRRHPDNDTSSAWQDLLEALSAALVIADEYNVLLAFEPEPANVAKNAFKARELLDTIGHPRLKICFDAANIAASDLGRPPQVVIEEAIELLGSDVVVAHGKDITADGEFCAAGTGIVPWRETIHTLMGAGFDDALILHSLTEADVPRALAAMNDA